METAKIATNSEGKPVFAVQINRDKAFAFLEFRTGEEANNAMRFDGITLQGYSLKVRRPKDYYDAEELVQNLNASNIPLALPAPNEVPQQDLENPNRLFVGGIPTYLTEDQVKDLFVSFGELAVFEMIREPTTGMFK